MVKFQSPAGNTPQGFFFCLWWKDFHGSKDSMAQGFFVLDDSVKKRILDSLNSDVLILEGSLNDQSVR